MNVDKIIFSDRDIEYTETEQFKQVYTFETAIDTAEAIRRDRGFGSLVHKNVYLVRYKKLIENNGNRKITMPEFNHAIKEILQYERLAKPGSTFPLLS